MKHISNQEIAQLLSEMAALYEMKDIRFKPRVYEKAALGIESLNKDIYDIYNEGGINALDLIPGVGKAIAKHIEEILKTGDFKEHKQLKKKIPVNITELTAIEGVGPQTVKVLYKKLKIRTIGDLEEAARRGEIKKLKDFGKKSEEKILIGIEFLKQSGGRFVLGFVLPEVRALEQKIKKFPEVKKVIIGGSVRRMKETIGDIDILVVSNKPTEVMDRFVRLPEVAHVYGKGETKTNVKLKNGLDADMRIVPLRSWGAALNYFTGSKAHNIHLRKIALKKGWKLNEYGLFKGKKFIGGRTEEELYKKLGLHYIEPEMREMEGEVETSKNNKLPKLIDYNDLLGDLQIQTTWTDGKNTIEEMAHAGKLVGLEYIAITDHTKSLAMTGGSDEKKLLRQMKEIDKVNKKLQASGYKILVLKGAEVNIMKDGTLDIKDNVLQQLDVVGAAVHSHFNLSKNEQTKRVVRAMENPHIDIIFHLTTRLINQRKPIELDIDKIIQVAKKTKTVLEIDAFPNRLDLKDDYIRKCVKAGVKMSIDSDAHSIKHLEYLKFGIAQARRGWAEKKDIINAWPLKKMLSMLKRS